MSRLVLCRKHRCLQQLTAAVIIPMLLAFCGCSGGPPKPQNQKKTIPVHGQVTVNGESIQDVKVTLNVKSGGDASNPTISVGTTGEDGTFHIQTYGSNDGAPAGEYVVTFTLIDPKKATSLFRRREDNSSMDLFGGKYSDPQSSEFNVTVEAGKESIEIGPYELTYEAEE